MHVLPVMWLRLQDVHCDCSCSYVVCVAQVTLTGRFAFVEFRMPEYATAALQLNGQIALMGNTLKIARPSSYVEPSQVGARQLDPVHVCLLRLMHSRQPYASPNPDGSRTSSA